MKKLFKVKVQIPGNPFVIWVPVKAKSKGDVIVIMDQRSMDNSKNLYFEEVEEINQQEYEKLLYKSWT